MWYAIVRLAYVTVDDGQEFIPLKPLFDTLPQDKDWFGCLVVGPKGKLRHL